MDAYDVLEKLGSGSFGTIRRIMRKADRKILVWKEIRYGRMNEKEKSMLVSEVNILRELKHPNIVRYKDRIIDRDSSTIFIIMEYCEQGDLAAVIRKYKRTGRRMEESRIWTLFFQLTCALHECHSRKNKILHRDIKPANVFIDKNQSFKLGDFGLARVLGTETQFAKTNVGTPYYMAPEQVNEVPYNEKCDIWSLGCLLYELAALAPPFEAANQLALAVKIKAGKVARLPDAYSEELNGVVRSMLQVDSARRPSTDDLLKAPRMQEQAEALVRSAAAVPLPFLDRYFSGQFRRLQLKEDEVNARAADVAAREKDLRGGASGGADKEEERKRKEAEREEERRRKEAGEALAAREEEVRRREREAADKEAAAEARVKAAAAKERAALEREEAAADKERGVAERERRVERARQEYCLMFNELMRKKRALDPASAPGTGPGSGLPPTAKAPDALLQDMDACPVAADPDAKPEPKPEREREAWGLKRSSSLPSKAPADDPPLQPRPPAADADKVAREEGAGRREAKGRVREVKSLGGDGECRSPTPHPRHGLLLERDEDAAALSKRFSLDADRDPAGLVQRRAAAEARKRQAVYGALMARRKSPAASESDDDDAPPAAPLRLNGRRVFSVPLPLDADSSIESPPPRLRPSAPVCGVRGLE